MVKIAGIEVNFNIAKVIKEFEKARTERNKMKIALALAKIETVAKKYDSKVALDFVENYKKNLKLMKEL